mmetsp:Transcript_23082/g.36114  ORF Transcript_23082/g.36114 Transcript_23082/m.36114 type:complete len:235 (-) Transcript_23082:123-827(-)
MSRLVLQVMLHLLVQSLIVVGMRLGKAMGSLGILLLGLLQQGLHTLGRGLSENCQHEGSGVEDHVQGLGRTSDGQLDIVGYHALGLHSNLVNAAASLQLRGLRHGPLGLMQCLSEGMIPHLTSGMDLRHSVGVEHGLSRGMSWGEDTTIGLSPQLVRGILDREAHLRGIEVLQVVVHNELAEEGVSHDHSLIGRLHAFCVRHSIGFDVAVDIPGVVDQRVLLALHLLPSEDAEW